MEQINRLPTRGKCVSNFCSFVLLSKKQNKKIYNNMKKTYVSPLAIEVNVEAEAMIAASLKMDGNKTVDTSAPNGQLSGGSRGQWGNLWN